MGCHSERVMCILWLASVVAVVLALLVQSHIHLYKTCKYATRTKANLVMTTAKSELFQPGGLIL